MDISHLTVLGIASYGRRWTTELAELDLEVEFRNVAEPIPPSDPRQLDRAATELALFDWLVLDGPFAAEAVLEAAGGFLPERLKIATAGRWTSEALLPWEVRADESSPGPAAAELASRLAARLGRRERLLLIEDEGAPTDLERQLGEAGGDPVRVNGFRLQTLPDPLTAPASDTDRPPQDGQNRAWLPALPRAAELFLNGQKTPLSGPWLAIDRWLAGELETLQREPVRVLPRENGQTEIEAVRSFWHSRGA